MSMHMHDELPHPKELKAEYPLSSTMIREKQRRDREIKNVFIGNSDKFILIVGPCSADNEDSVCEYITRLSKINDKVKIGRAHV